MSQKARQEHSILTPKTKERPTAFRADIGGLRGVAILLVLFFHAAIPGFAGGFLGVDVFYVISGYLITGVLIREKQSTGKISLKTFYARRVRRLLPAATVVLLSTLLAAYFLAPRLLLSTIAFDIASAALFLSNMNFAHHATNYFAQTAPSPVLHFWSLSVEEQYYMIYPAFFLLISRGTKKISLRVFLSVLTIGSLSFWFATWLLTRNQSWAFFSLPSRAWELALGALIAASTYRLEKLPKPILAIAGWCGGALLIFSAVTLKQSDPFPGPYALLPTLATALLLTAGLAYSAKKRKLTLLYLPVAALTLLPLRYLGKISYSLYLWHWPILILAAYQYKDGLSLTQRAALAALSIILAAVTYHIIENPLRHGRIIGRSPQKNLTLAAVTILLVTSTSLAVSTHFNAVAAASVTAQTSPLTRLLPEHQTPKPPLVKNSPATAQPSPTQSSTPHPLPTPPPHRIPATPPPTPTTTPKPKVTPKPVAQIKLPALAADGSRLATKDSLVPENLIPALIAADSDRPLPYNDRCHTQQNLPPSTKACLYGDLNGTRTMVLFGDSHALAWFPAVEQVALANHWKLLSLTMSACTPADIPAFDRATNAVMQNCTLWRNQSIAKIIAAKPYVVLVTGTRGFVTSDENGNLIGGLQAAPQWEAGMNRTLAKLKTASPHVVMIMDIPQSKYDPKLCLSQTPESTLACATPLSYAISPPGQAEEGKIATQNNVKIIDPTLWVCPTDPCPVVTGNLLIYLDAGHLTATYASALSQLLNTAVLAAMKAPPK